MLSNAEVVIYAAAIAVLLPLVLWSLATGAAVPERSWFFKYYRAERHLMLAGNLFILVVIAVGIIKLAAHFGYLDAESAQTTDKYAGIAFGLTLLMYLVFWIRAYLKVRSASSPQ
jgi:hypothetical protein